MFTGIIETVGEVMEITAEGFNKNLLIRSAISGELKVDQSVSHNGVCLTVTRVENGAHWATAVRETLEKSNTTSLKQGSPVNLERSMLNNGRFDGHLVQGHVDQVANVTSIREEGGSWVFDFRYDPRGGNVTIEKGSACVNGISLTTFNSGDGTFSAAIIPYTYAHTNLHKLRLNDSVNIEFDMVGKYIKRFLAK